jgi:hypothetical protein
MTPRLRHLAPALLLALTFATAAPAGVLDKQKQLDRQTFWDNRDWDWYRANVPFFECPDAGLVTTWYYRWELLTKHLVYGSPNSGYAFTEFIDRPFWSGTYGAISCPAGLQLYEARWLAEPRYARDYCRYWFRTPGAQPRRYSTWLADAAWAVHLVHPEDDFVKELLPDLVKNYAGWEARHFDKDVGLFWQTGHDDGMEFNVNSRQTTDPNAGAPGYRPTLNSYLYADALAIARIAELKGDKQTAKTYRDKASKIKQNLQKKLWDDKRQFFFHLAKRDEKLGDDVVKALSLTYQTGKYAGSTRGRELIGYVPWQFGLPDRGYESAWKPLMDKDGFFAAYGPTTVERKDPLFALSKRCCWWSGQSWPYATSQTLKAMANLLQDYRQDVVGRADYLKLLLTFSATHRKGGKPYLAEACHPDTGSWEGHDNYNHSEHYFHSCFNDLVITGLVGLRPRADDVLEVVPLASESWDYFALDDVPYRGRRVSVVWDKTGERYKLGKGLHLLAGGKKLATSEKLGRLTAKLPAVESKPAPKKVAVNYAVNNDGRYYPRVTASYVASGTSPGKLIDGNYWYHASPPNRWTCEGSPDAKDWVLIDFGTNRTFDSVKLYLLDDDDGKVSLPEKIELQTWDGKAWSAVKAAKLEPAKITGHRPNVVRFEPRSASKVRATFTHAKRGKSGLTEIEVWGESALPVEPAAEPKGNLAYNPGKQKYPRASASYTSRFDRVEWANDGVVSFSPTPHNRWTSYESPNETDWLAIDFGEAKQTARLELAIYDDRGGVQAPQSYAVQYWDGKAWADVSGAKKTPERPVGGQFNEVRFDKVKTTKMRVVFTHRGKARSGVSEILIWAD